MLTIDKNSRPESREPFPDAREATVAELTALLAAIAERPIDIVAARFTLEAAGRLKSNKLKRNSVEWKDELDLLVQGLFPLCDRLPFEPQESDLHPLLEQLMSVELPLMLVRHAAASIRAMDGQPNPDELASSSAARMAESVFQWLDDDGWPHADVLPIFAPLLETWARSMKLIRKIKVSFSGDASGQLEWAFRQLLRQLRPDGKLMLGRYDSLPISSESWKSLRKLTSDKRDHDLLKLQKVKANAKRGSKQKNKLAKSKKSAKSKQNAKMKKLPESSSISEWGLSGILRSDWNPDSPSVCFDYAARSFEIEVRARRTLLLGECLPDIQLDGNPCMPLDDFEIVCNQHDDDLDYVEFQMELSEGVTLNRQLILSRDEEFLIIADSVIPLVSGLIEYQCDWPLANEISVLPETETREVYLQDSKIRSLVLPVALPEWLVGPTPGKLEHSDSSLRMQIAADGHGIYVPMLFDLSQKRSKQKRTWRPLTVAEDQQTVRPDIAAAFRVQIGEQQWFFYRAIAERGNRTYFGENFQGEFMIARFDSEDGSVTELMRIE